MKNLVALVLVLIAATVYAGTIRTTPSEIVLHEPTTNKVELISQTYYYGETNYLEIKYNVVDSNGSVVSSYIATVEGEDFTTFVSGFGPTMLSRGDVVVWADIQTRYDLVP